MNKCFEKWAESGGQQLTLFMQREDEYSDSYVTS